MHLKYLFGFLALFPSACGAQENRVLPNSVVQISDGPLLSAPRATHALVKTTDGSLVAVGGCVSDGCDPGPESATIDIISPEGKLIAVAPMLHPRVQPAAVALSGNRVLIVGGWVNGRVSATTEIFDVTKRRSVAGPTMATARNAPAAIMLADGRVLIAGGYDGNSPIAGASIFYPATGALKEAGALNVARSGATASLLPDGRILIVGGGNSKGDTNTALASAEIFDPATKAFSLAASLNQRRYKHGAISLPNGDVLIVGGSDERDYGGKLRSVEIYDAATGRFRKAGNMAKARFKLADGLLLVDDDKVLIAVGDEYPELFDLASGKGVLLPDSLGSTWNYATIKPLDRRTALLAGGYREGSIELTDRSWIVRF